MACPNRRLGSCTPSKACATGCQRCHDPYDALVCAAGIKVRARELPTARDLSCAEGE
jgi:hypothetical protein